MKDLLKEVLEEGLFADNNAESLRGNFMAGEILFLYNNGGMAEATDLNRLFAIAPVNRHPVEPTSERKEPTDIVDCRISRMMARAFRGIPFKDDKSYYGLDFSNGHGPVSTVVLGANGAGKTSLYCGLEMACMGKSNCARLRGYFSDEEQMKFIKHIGLSPTDAQVKVVLTNGSLVGLNLDHQAQEELIGECCFCSDYDIETLEKYTYGEEIQTYNSFIHQQLGLENICRLIDVLKDYNEKFEIRAFRNREIIKHREDIMTEYDVVRSVARVSEALESGNHATDVGVGAKVKGFFLEGKHKSLEKLESNLSYAKERIFEGIDLDSLKRECVEEFNLLNQINGTHFDVGHYHDTPSHIHLHSVLFDMLRNNVSVFSLIYGNALKAIDHYADSEEGEADLAYLLDYHYFELLCSYRSRFTETLKRRIDNPTDSDDLGELEKGHRNTIFDWTRFEEVEPLMDMNAVERTSKETRELIEYLNRKLLEWDKDIFDILRKIIPTIFNNSFLDDSERIEITYGVATDIVDGAFVPNIDSPKTFALSVVKEYKGPDGTVVNLEKAEPRLYFNTFRHKLFCFTLKLALACCYMRLNKCRCPIIIDDVFNASDFCNRNSIKDIIINLRRAYSLVMRDGGNGSFDCPLQIILFTQDEIIAEKVYQGISKRIVTDIHDNDAGKITNPVRFVRLIPIPYYGSCTPVWFDKNHKMLSSGFLKRFFVGYEFYDVATLINHNFDEKEI